MRTLRVSFLWPYKICIDKNFYIFQYADVAHVREHGKFPVAISEHLALRGVQSFAIVLKRNWWTWWNWKSRIHKVAAFTEKTEPFKEFKGGWFLLVGNAIFRWSDW